MTDRPGSAAPASADVVCPTLASHAGPFSRAQRIAALHHTGLLDTPPEAAFDRLTQLAQKILRVPVAVVSLVDTQRQFFKSSVGIPAPWEQARETPLSHSFCQYVADSAQPLVIPDARQNPIVRHNPAIPELGVVAYLGVPLRAVTGESIGSFCAIDSQPRHWTAADLELLTTLAEAVSSEIALRAHIQERRAAEAALRQREGHAQLLGLLSERTRHVEAPEAVLETVVRAVGAHLELAHCVYAEMDEAGDGLAIRGDYAAAGLGSLAGHYHLVDFGPRIAADQQAGRTTVMGDAAVERLGPGVAEALAELATGATVCCPLMRGGVLRAIFAVHRSAPHAWCPAEVRLIEEIAERCWGYIESARSARRLHEAERLLREHAEAANEAKDHFLAVLSHELRTPLTPVLMTLNSMERAASTPENLREDLRMMRRNIELETLLIDDLLDVSRVISGKLTLALKQVNLQEMVRHVCNSCRGQFAEKGVHLNLTQDAEVGHVRADPIRLQQVFWNVLKNAAKFTPAGGTVDVRTRLCGAGRVAVEIRDSGMGIPAEVLPRIFNAFEQGASGITQRFGGLGLGLAISQAIVALHQGTIRAASAGTDQGALFTIELPLDATPHSAACAAFPAVGDAAPRAPLIAAAEALRLLIVEDHADTARVLARLLTLQGHAVKTAATIATALELAGGERFDLVISDVGLPDGSGYELMTALQSLYPIRGIAMSGYGMEDDLRQSRAAGFCEHLVKPLDFTRLEGAIRQVGARQS